MIIYDVLFHDVNSVLHTVSSIHYNVFHSAILILFTRMDKKEQETVRNLTARLTMTEDSRVRRCLFHTSYTIFSVFYTKPISIKSYAYIHHWRPTCYFRDKNRRFKVETWVGMTWDRINIWYSGRLRSVTFSETRPYNACWDHI